MTTQKIYLYHSEENDLGNKISTALENLNLNLIFFISIIFYYLLLSFKYISFLNKFFFPIIFVNYSLFCILSFFIRIKATNKIRNCLFLFFLDLILDNNNEISFHDMSLYYISIQFINILNFLIVFLFGNIITLKDLFYNKKNDLEKIMFFVFYFLFDFFTLYLYIFFHDIIKLELQPVNYNTLIGILFSLFFHEGSSSYEKLYKKKKPYFGTVLKRYAFILFEIYTAGFYLINFFENIVKKQILDEKFLFLLFLAGAFVIGFIIEWFFKEINFFENIRKNFNIFFTILIFIAYFPYIWEKKEITRVFIIIIIILIIIKIAKEKLLNFKYFFSDSFILISVALLLINDSNIFILYLILFLYGIKSLLEYSIFKINLEKWICKIVLNFLLLLLCLKAKAKTREEEIEDEKKKLKEKLKNLKAKNEQQNVISNYLWNDIVENRNKRYNYCLHINFDENNCINKTIKKLQKKIDKPKKMSDLDKYKKNIPKVDGSTEFYYLEQILKKADKENELSNIEKKLEENYNKSLIDDDEYKPKWDNNKEKYLSKFCLFSLDLQKNEILENLGLDKESYDEEILRLLNRIKNENKINNNMVTIFVSGFLTANKNSFEVYFKDYFFKENHKSDYYFYLWPSCDGLNYFNGIGCNFEEAYDNAEIAGEILSYIIGSKRFFNSKVNLVGHSLGCKVIYHCLDYISKNYKNLKGTINDVIFLAGATTMDDKNFSEIVKNFVGGIFIHCFNSNDEALFLSKPFSDSPVGARKINSSDNKIINYETDLGHTNYCCNFGNILKKIEEKGNKNISFI